MARKQLTWSIRARQDVLDILRFYRKRNGNTVYCRKLRDEFRKATERIRDNVEIGQVIDKTNYRFVIVEEFQLIYRENENEIILVTVWDARRNPEDLKI